MSKGKGRRLVYVSEDLVKEATEHAKREGETLGRFVEEAVRRAIKACELGYSPKEASELLEVTHASRILGGAYVPQEVLDHLISLAYRADKERLQAKFYESGRLHGKYLKEKFQNPVQALKSFLQATRWDLAEVEVKQDGSAVKLRCISTVLTAEGTELLAKFIEGAIHGMGYRNVKSDCLKGMLILKFSLS